MSSEKELGEKKILELIAKREAENKALKKLLMNLTKKDIEQSVEQTLKNKNASVKK